MAKSAMMYCPHCRKVGQLRVELFTEMPETDVFRCSNGHAFPDRVALMAMNPDLIKLIPHEKPQTTDVKLEVWIDPALLNKFNELKPNCINATVQSILSLFLYGDPVIIDGVQAKKLHELGVKNGQEILASLEVAKTIEADLNTANEKIAIFQSVLAAAGAHANV